MQGTTDYHLDDIIMSQFLFLLLCYTGIFFRSILKAYISLVHLVSVFALILNLTMFHIDIEYTLDCDIIKFCLKII